MQKNAVKTNLIAGSVKQITKQSGDWIFLDIGFSNKQRSCGLLDGDSPFALLRFNEARSSILSTIRDAKGPINLLIEAPLSTAFDHLGYPVGRSIEKNGSKTRYWYNGLGCAVMVAAVHLLVDICNSGPSHEVRLFEGFVSFKEPTKHSTHERDVRLLQEVVLAPAAYASAIIPPHQLYRSSNHKLESVLQLANVDIGGIPPVVKR